MDWDSIIWSEGNLVILVKCFVLTVWTNGVMAFLGEISLYDGIFRKLCLSMAFLGSRWLSMVFYGFSLIFYCPFGNSHTAFCVCLIQLPGYPLLKKLDIDFWRVRSSDGRVRVYMLHMYAGLTR